MRTVLLGATGLVGRTMLSLLETRAWADEPPVLLTSERSAGKSLPFRGADLVCRDAAGFDPAGARIALFSAGREASGEHASRFAQAGCWVVDNSSAWRRDPDVPLVVPEINADTLPRRPGIVANPNCSTIQIAMAVAPLHRAFGLRACHVTTLQAVSGAGGRAQRVLHDELQDGLRGLRCGDPIRGEDTGGGMFARQIACNVLPEIGGPLPDGSYEEEAKVVHELRRILDLPRLAVTCLATRVPVWNGHAASVRCVFESEVDRDEAVAALRASPGVVVDEDPHGYLTPLEVSGGDAVCVGRLRREPDRPDVLLLWVVADNVRKGAALNALQIADLLAARTERE